MASYEVTADSKLWVEGTSSLHDWDCAATAVQGTIQMDWSADESPTIASAQITVPVEGLDCDNGTMNKKLGEALKSKDNDSIVFELTSATVSTVAAADSFEVATDGQFTMAGRTNTVQLRQHVSSSDGSTVVFRGSMPVSLEDYDMKPPTAMFGTIKTGNEVTIHFEIVATRVPDAG